MAVGAQKFIFPLLLFGFGILVSLWPFHTWAPLGYGSAPTATAMLHAGVLKKFGLYGLIRIALPFVPEGAQSMAASPRLARLGNILYCGWVAMRQRDLNFLLGNSSVAHMGFCFLGIASLNLIGVTGAVVVMIAHGLLAALTFGLSGYLNEQTGTLEMSKLGGLAQEDALHRHGARHGRDGGLRTARLREFRRRTAHALRRVEDVVAVRRGRCVGRAGHWRDLHAARGAQHPARAGGGESAGCAAMRTSGAKCRSRCLLASC